MNLITFWKSLLHLFYPEICFGCNDILVSQELMLCTTCLYHLPLTDHFLSRDNELLIYLKGKIELQTAQSLLYLTPKGRVEQMIYHLKYNNHPQIGYYLGQLFGERLISSETYQKIDIIVPIPLHPKRKSKRGYNQSEYFANGIASKLDAVVCNNLLYRSKFTRTQTQLVRLERIQNMEEVFYCKNPQRYHECHMLLVDDVITTGATLVSAAEILIESIPSCKVSIGTIARA